MACHREPPFTAEQVAWIDQRIADARSRGGRPYVVGELGPQVIAPRVQEGGARG